MKTKMLMAMIIFALIFVVSCKNDSNGSNDGGIKTGVSVTVTYPANVAGDLTVKISTADNFSVNNATESFTLVGDGSAGATLTKTFAIELPAGDYYARAFIDADSDGSIDQGEYAMAFDGIVYNATPGAITVLDGNLTDEAITLNRQAGYCQVTGLVESFDHPAGTMKFHFYGTYIDYISGFTELYTDSATYDVSVDENDGMYLIIPGETPIPRNSETYYTVNLDPIFTWKLKVYLDENGNDILDTGEIYAYYYQQETTATVIPDMTADDSLALGTFSISYTEE